MGRSPSICYKVCQINSVAKKTKKTTTKRTKKSPPFKFDLYKMSFSYPKSVLVIKVQLALDRVFGNKCSSILFTLIQKGNACNIIILVLFICTQYYFHILAGTVKYFKLLCHTDTFSFLRLLPGLLGFFHVEVHKNQNPLASFV